MLTYPFILLVLLTFVTVVAVPCNIVALPLLGLLDRVRPQARSQLLLLLVAVPWLLGCGVLASSVVDILFGACSAGEVCLWNEDPRLVNHFHALLVIPLAASLCLVLARLSLRLITSRRAVTALERTSARGQADDIRIVPTATGLAFAARNRVFVSSSLCAALDPSQFRAMLLHERAHLDRSDGACQIIARVLSCILVPPARWRYLNALTLANEQACDEAAGQVEGRLITAGAILAAERFRGAERRMLTPAFAESFVAQRVRRLMEPPPPPWRAARVYGATIVGLLSVFLLGDLVYYIGMTVLYPSIMP